MRRAALLSFCVATALALVAFAVRGVADERALAFTLSVAPTMVAAELPPDAEACQTPVAVSEPFSRVRFQVGTFGRAGEALAVTVKEHGTALASGRLRSGYPDVARPIVELDREVDEGRSVAVCLRNEGRRRVALYGGTAAAKTRSAATLDGSPLEVDLTVEFLRQRPRSALAALPDMFRRASVFSAGWVGPWTFWLLAAAVFAGVPVLLGWSLLRAAEAEAQETAEGSR